MLGPSNPIPHVVVTPSHEGILVAIYNCDFATGQELLAKGLARL